MKVIGKTTIGQGHHKTEAYIAIVTHDELCTIVNKARYNQRGDVKRLEVGDEFDLCQGHNFRAEITDAVGKMAEAYKAFAKVAPMAAEFAGIVQRKDDTTGSGS